MLRRLEVEKLDRRALIDDAVLVGSELASNAMLHAGGIAAVGVTSSGEGIRLKSTIARACRQFWPASRRRR